MKSSRRFSNAVLWIAAAFVLGRLAFDFPTDRTFQFCQTRVVAQELDDFAFDSDETTPDLESEKGLRVVAKVPHGVLFRLDGARDVLALEGTPQEMGEAHGLLLKEKIESIRARVNAAGAVASLKEGVDFFGKTDEAIERTRPFTPDRFYEEIDALANAAGLDFKEVRRLNNFMELFHCSGAAMKGDATVGGQVLHIRVLDYMRDAGLQEDAVTILYQPKDRFAWISVAYAGFVGTVTAMNEKGLTIGEMGGGGEGKWDGLPMAFMMRRVVEECSTVDEALALMKSVPLTCDYYYVLSDAQGNLAAVEAIAESENPVVVLRPGESTPKLPGALEDVVYVSAKERAVALYERLRDNYGKIDVETLQEIIKRPVAMKSNLHDAIFAPETLDVWSAEAGKTTPACDEPYVYVNLNELKELFQKEKVR